MTEDEQTSNQLTNSANHKIIGGCTYENNSIIEDKLGVSINLKINWRSKIFLDYYNEVVADERMVINANASVNLYKRVKISVGMNNLLDNKYVEFSEMPGRTFSSTFEVSY